MPFSISGSLLEVVMNIPPEPSNYLGPARTNGSPYGHLYRDPFSSQAGTYVRGWSRSRPCVSSSASQASDCRVRLSGAWACVSVGVLWQARLTKQGHKRVTTRLP